MNNTFLRFGSAFLAAGLLLTQLSAAPASYGHTEQRRAVDTSLFHYYPKQVAKAVQALHSLPEVREVIARAQQKGLIRITPGPKSITKQFGACWDSGARTIYLNMERCDNEGEIINSILFEMHNALADERLRTLTDTAARGGMDKESYVESVERTEHNNAVQTSRILDKGIAQGVFPESARWPILDKFEDHYRLQQLQGHSGSIAEQYDSFFPNKRVKPYKGTVPMLSSLTQRDREDFMLYLTVKNDLESSNPVENNRAKNFLQRELSQIQKRNSAYGEARSRQKHQIMRHVFKDCPDFSRLVSSQA